MRWYSSGGTTPPVGLLGELRMSNFVRGVTAFSMAEAFTLKPSSGFVSTKTGVPPAYFTMSGKLTQYGAGIMTSSPGRTSTLITLKMECLPPTLTTHSFASYEEPSSRLCQAQIASRSGMMPPAGVYFDLFSSIALIAAFLMWSGVGKSGSPGPKSAISTPRDFSFSASEITAAVGEICMRLIRSVSCTFAPRKKFTVCETRQIRLRNFRAQALLHDFRHQALERCAKLRNLAHQLRA